MPTDIDKAKSIGKSIPALLLARRKELGLTLKALADKAELSPAFVSQAERGKAVPSIVSLMQLAAALETDINYFLAPPKIESLVRRADDPVRVNIDSPVTYYRLDGDVRNPQLTALLMTIPPHCELPKVHRQEGDDFFYVLKGSKRIVVGDEVFDLNEGDSIHINSQIDHNAINLSDRECQVLWVGTPAIFP